MRMIDTNSKYQQYERYIPNAFDETLSIIEKMNKMIRDLLEIGMSQNEVIEFVKEMDEFTRGKGLVDATNNKLSEWVNDGTLENMINVQLFSTLNTEINRISSETASMKPKTSHIINVKEFGAKGDGVTNDTESFKQAIVSLPAGGTLIIPSGVYMVNAETDTTFTGNVISLKSDMVIDASPSAKLKAIPTSSGYYTVIQGENVSNVEIRNLNIEGERSSHLGTGGEWGHGLALFSCTNIRVLGGSFKECWGDGIYIGAKTPGLAESKNFTVRDVTCDNNRRQGMSITHATQGFISNSVFSNTNGTLPQAGVDVEPNSNQYCRDITFDSCIFKGNSGDGFLVASSKGDSNVHVVNSVAQANTGRGFNIQSGNRCTINNCDSKNNGSAGIRLAEGRYNTISNCTVYSNALGGISLSSTRESKVINCNVYNHENSQVTVLESTLCIVEGNSIIDGGSSGLALNSSSSCQVINNISSENSKTTDNTGFNITLTGTSSRNTITGNKVRRGSGVNRTRAGINVNDSTCSNNFISNNDCYEGGTVGIRNAGTNTIFGSGNIVLDGTYSSTAS